MTEYVGDKTIALQMTTSHQEVQEIEARLVRLQRTLRGKEGTGLHPHYASDHAEELLQDLAFRARELARHLDSLATYTRTGSKRDGDGRLQVPVTMADGHEYTGEVSA